MQGVASELVVPAASTAVPEVGAVVVVVPGSALGTMATFWISVRPVPDSSGPHPQAVAAPAAIAAPEVTTPAATSIFRGITREWTCCGWDVMSRW